MGNIFQWFMTKTRLGHFLTAAEPRMYGSLYDWTEVSGKQATCRGCMTDPQPVWRYSRTGLCLTCPAKPTENTYE